MALTFPLKQLSLLSVPAKQATPQEALPRPLAAPPEEVKTEKASVTLRFKGPKGLSGFKHFWCMTVNGFEPKKHCMASFIGVRHKVVNTSMPAEVTLPDLDVGSFLYVCGVAEPWSWSNNFHFVGRVIVGVDMIKRTYLGTAFGARGLKEFQFPSLPDGFLNLPKSYTTCRNFQFGQHAFGGAEAAWPNPAETPSK